MNTTLLRAGALSCALLATTALTTPALAQAAPPPVRHNIDRNGVDVALGTFEFSQTVLSIGPDWPHGLQFTRMYSQGSWSNNFTGGVFHDGSKVLVSIGNTSARFTYSGGLNLTTAGSFSTDLGDGATLTRSGGTFTYTNGRGEVARFTAAINGSGRIVADSGRIVDIAYPNGTKVTYNYRTQQYCDENHENCVDVVRLQSVNNNFGYQIRFAYSQDTLASADDVEAWTHMSSGVAINTAVEACDPTVLSCTLTGSWPTATFATVSGTETVTLPDSHSWTFGNNSGTGFSVRRPGASGDDIAVTDTGGGVTSVVNAAGTWSYAYGTSGGNATTTVTGPSSYNQVYTYDPSPIENAQDILSVQDSLSHTTSYQYDGNHRVTRATAPEGNYAGYTYDGRGNVTEVRNVAKSGSGLSDIVESASYDSTCSNIVTCNLPNSTTDARGNTTDYTWNSTHGGLLTVTAPVPATGLVRPQTRIGYTSATVGSRTVYRPTSISACQTTSSCSAGADEALTTIAYSGSNDLVSSVAQGNGSGTLTATSAFTYDDIGNRITVDGPLSGTGDTSRVRYNALRQVIGMISPDPDGGGSLKHRAMRNTYDDAGLLTNVEIGTVNSQSDSDWTGMTVLEGHATERDDFGRPVVQRLTSGGTTYALTQSSFDARGRLQCGAQRMNESEFATASLPSDACTLDTQGLLGPDRITRMTYDAVDRATLMQSGYGVSGVVADEVATSYSNNGQVATVTDAEGNMTTYEYDGFDRLRNTRFPSPTTDGVSAPTSGTGNDYEQLGYDANGNVVSRRMRDGTTNTFTYDTLDRMTEIVRNGGAWGEYGSTFTYDNLSRMATATSGNSQALTFAYDALGRELSETSSFYGTVAASQYDLAGRRTRLTWQDGFYVDYDYDVLGEMTAARENGATSGAGVLATFAYDDRGRRTGVSRGNGTSSSYSYDDVDRLTGLTQNLNSTPSDLTLGFSYNPASEITVTTRDNTAYSYTGDANGSVSDTINGRNQVTASGGTSISHDGNGNVSAIGGTSYGYTSDNNLATAGSEHYAYDAAGRMYYQNSDGTVFNYDGSQLIVETNGSSVLRRYVPGPDLDEPLVWYEGSGTSTRRWLHADNQGSIVSVSDSSGNLVGSNPNRYDEYGNPQGTLTGRFGYTGQAWLPTSSLYYYRARMYNPALSGRFMQTDPIGYGGGMNLYAYVRNNPVNFADPLGLDDTQHVFVDGNFFLGSGGGGGGGGGGSLAGGGRTISEDPTADVVVTGTRRPLSYYSGGLIGGGSPGIGHNNPPPEEQEIVVQATKRVAIYIVRGGLRVVTSIGSVIIYDVFFPSPGGESEEAMEAFNRRQEAWIRQHHRESTIDRSEEVRRLRAAQAARDAQDRRTGNAPGLLKQFLDFMRILHGGGGAGGW